jgi:alpha-glucosidase
MDQAHHPYQNAVVYQIYVRSFADSNADGVGDLQGIREKLGYIAGEPDSLGADAIWLTPIYASPMADMGYDIADYRSVDPLFGSLADFDALVKAAHARELRVLMDFVPNHTSDQHAWFKESRSSRDNPKRDWYVWRDPKAGGTPPNNWLSVFGGSAWKLDATTGQYYLHTFLSQQPDLNWANPEVRAAVTDAMRFWFDRGVDGLRVDSVLYLAKDPQLRDNPPNPYYRPDIDDPVRTFQLTNSRSGPELASYIHQLSAVVEEYPDRFMFMEGYPDHNDPDSYIQMYRLADAAVSAPLNFGLLFVPWEAAAVKAFIDDFQARLATDLEASYVLGNHDKPRLATRLGDAASRTAAMLLLSLPGAVFVYNGDELGLHNVPIPPDQARDNFEHNVPGMGLGRDPERTPMQWNAERYAGFSTHTPWLPVASDASTHNVASLGQDPHSILTLYREMIALRRRQPALHEGGYRPCTSGHADVFCFQRTSPTETIAVYLNLSDQPATIAALPAGSRLLLSTYLDEPKVPTTEIKLRPNEGWIVAL